MKSQTKTVTYHENFEMGRAPYQFVGLWSAPPKEKAHTESYQQTLRDKPKCCHFQCDHCFTALIHHYIIQDADGKQFVVGCSCVDKLGNQHLTSAVKAAELARKREIAKAKREARTIARIKKLHADRLKAEEHQRAVNGGLTDIEIRQAEHEKAAKIIADRCSHIAALLRDGMNGFRDSIADSLEAGNLPSGRGVHLAAEIAAKVETGKRSNSKICKAAYDKHMKTFSSLTDV